MSFRRRIVVLVAAAVAVSIVAASALVYVVMRSELTSGLDERLRGQTSKVMFVSRRAPPSSVTVSRPASGGLKVRVDERRTVLGTAEHPVGRATGIVVPGPLGGSTAVAQLVTGDGDVLRSLGDAPDLPMSERALAVAAGRADAFYSDARVDGVAVRMLTVRGPDGSVLTVAEPRGDVDSALHRLLAILVGVSGAGVAAAAGLGVLVSRRALTPVVALHRRDRARRRDAGPQPPPRHRRRQRRAGAAGRQLQHDAGRARRRPRGAAAAGRRRLARAAHAVDRGADLDRGARRRARPAGAGARPRAGRDPGAAGGPERADRRPRRPRAAGGAGRGAGGGPPRPPRRRAGRARPPSRARDRVPPRRPRERRAGRPRAPPPAPSPTCSTTPSSTATGSSRSRSATAASASATAAPASPRRTCRTSSTASTARAERAACPAPASGWRSCGRWPRPTAAACAPRRPPAAARGCSSHCLPKALSPTLHGRAVRWTQCHPDLRGDRP